MFDAVALQSAVSKALTDAHVAPGHTNAFALVVTSDRRVQAVLSTKVNDVWEIDSVITAGVGVPLEAGVMVKATW